MFRRKNNLTILPMDAWEENNFKQSIEELKKFSEYGIRLVIKKLKDLNSIVKNAYWLFKPKYMLEGASGREGAQKIAGFSIKKQ